MSKPRVLVAEDDVHLVKLYRTMLRGWEVTVASNGLEALYLIGCTKPQLLILDLCLPVVDGIEIMQSLRADPANDDLPIFMVTAMKGSSWPVLSATKNVRVWQKPIDWPAFTRAALKAVGASVRTDARALNLH